jgi:hypothetical protein
VKSSELSSAILLWEQVAWSCSFSFSTRWMGASYN